MFGGLWQIGATLSQTGLFKMIIIMVIVKHPVTVSLYSSGTEAKHVCSILSKQAQVGARCLRVYWHLLWGNSPFPWLFWPSQSDSAKSISQSCEVTSDFDFAGPETASGTQTADLGFAHQASPTDHEVSAAAQGWSATEQEGAPELQLLPLLFLNLYYHLNIWSPYCCHLHSLNVHSCCF